MRENGHNKLTVADAVEINQQVMISMARTHVFAEELMRKQHDFSVIEDRHIGVMRAVLVSTLVDKRTSATELIGRIQLQNGVKENVARDQLYETESLGLVHSVVKDDDRRRNWWNLRPGIAQKLDDFGLICLTIADVVRAQIAEPMNSKAGSDLIEDRFYFNILDPEQKEAARNALTELLGKATPTRTRKED